MNTISKEEFHMILDRQLKSGLSIKDFCANESYSVSSFHYWKNKFGLTRSRSGQASEATPGKLAPISINLPVNRTVPVPPTGRCMPGEITVKLPTGVQVSFKGGAQTEVAMNYLNQIFSAHVLPE